MNLQLVDFFSSDYFAMLSLRIAILREPFDIPFGENDIMNERQDFFVGCFDKHTHEILACCVLTPLDMGVVKLRQMAVKQDRQGVGIGQKTLLFAEKVAKERDYLQIVLNARKQAVGFYEKNNYTLVGNEFMEVGLPHYKMHKIIR